MRALRLTLFVLFAFSLLLSAQEKRTTVTIKSPEAGTKLSAPKLSTQLAFRVMTRDKIKTMRVRITGPLDDTGFEICGDKTPCRGEPPVYSIAQATPVFFGRNVVTVSVTDAAGETHEASVQFLILPPPKKPRPPLVTAAPPPVTLVPAILMPPGARARLLVITPMGDEIAAGTGRYEFVEALQPLIHHKNATGMPAKLITLEEIYQKPQYRGRDHAEIIKKAIYDEWKKSGIDYVMLVGDVDWFPVRYTRTYDLSHWGHGYSPSDLYYADIADATGAFSSWDYDGDMMYGEAQKNFAKSQTDFNQDRMHLDPEVAVGRVPISDVNELKRYVQKVISYELTASPTWFKRALLITGNYPGSDWTNDTIGNQLSGVGFTLVKRYDGSTPAANRDTLIQTDFNHGAGFVSYVGHGDGPGGVDKDGGLWAGWIDYTDIVPLANDAMLPIVTAAACSTARFHFGPTFRTFDGFDQPPATWPDGRWIKYNDMTSPAPVQPPDFDRDGFAEQFLVKRMNGAIAYIGAYTGTQGASHDISKNFYEAYAGGSHILGDAWNGALRKFVSQYYTPLGYPTDSWVAYDQYYHMHKMMLFGDPSLRIGGLGKCPSYCPKEDCLNRCQTALDACLERDPAVPKSACVSASAQCKERCTVCDACQR